MQHSPRRCTRGTSGAIPAIKPHREAGINTVISINKYRSAIAKAAISGGADLISDVSTGTLDKDMLKVAASLAVLICLMHMRDNPSSIKSLNSYPAGVISGVISKLEKCVLAA